MNRYPDYTFLAKTYHAGSVFGMEHGPISKLVVWRADREVMNYDRGWDQMPATRRDWKVLKEILAGFRRSQRDAESGIAGEEQKQASRRSFLSGRLRAPGFRPHTAFHFAATRGPGWASVPICRIRRDTKSLRRG